MSSGAPDNSTPGSSCGASGGSSADPDVDGIGIRYSIYGQALLALAPALLRILLCIRMPDKNEPMPKLLHEAFKANGGAVLATGCALLVAAFIEGRNGQLDVYNALMVLQLSWMNSLTAAFPTVYLLLDHHGNKWSRIRGLFWFGLFSVHATAAGAFGIWLYSNIDAWTPGCVGDLVVVFGGHIFDANGPNIRVAALIISVVLVIPVVNGFGIGIIVFLLRRFNYWALQWVPLAIWILPIIILICSSEQFVWFNSGAVLKYDEENSWGFGQVMAIMLLVFPLYVVLKQGVQMLRRQLGLEEWEEPEPGRRDEVAGEEKAGDV